MVDIFDFAAAKIPEFLIKLGGVTFCKIALLLVIIKKLGRLRQSSELSRLANHKASNPKLENAEFQIFQ